MAFIVESFDTRTQRDVRVLQLKASGQRHIVKYSDALQVEQGWATCWIVAYPPQLPTEKQIQQAEPVNE